jgi:hypothetical protein
MRAFMERVNATLPIEDPDYILLTLVQGHATQACGVGCPSGQTSSESGRCLPNAVVAARAGKDVKHSADADGVAGARAAHNRLPPPAPRAGLASIAKSPVGPLAARATPARVAEDKVAASSDAGRAERLPWQNDDAPAPRRVSRPDGMMSIGGPRHEADPTQAPPSATITAPRGRMHVLTTEDDVDRRNDRAAPVLAPSDQALAEEYLEPEYAAKPVPSASKRKQAKSGKRGKSAPAYAKKVKPAKFFYYAGNNNSRRRGFPRPGSPSYNMLQAMGGIF